MKIENKITIEGAHAEILDKDGKVINIIDFMEKKNGSNSSSNK
jgi:hypothetical protein